MPCSRPLATRPRHPNGGPSPVALVPGPVGQTGAPAGSHRTDQEALAHFRGLVGLADESTDQPAALDLGGFSVRPEDWAGAGDPLEGVEGKPHIVGIVESLKALLTTGRYSDVLAFLDGLPAGAGSEGGAFREESRILALSRLGETRRAAGLARARAHRYADWGGAVFRIRYVEALLLGGERHVAEAVVEALTPAVIGIPDAAAAHVSVRT